MTEGVCACGHQYADHEHIPGQRFDDLGDATIHAVNDDGTVGPAIGGFADCWICTGGRLVLNPTDDISPWEYVCGCVLHSPPPTPVNKAAA